MCIPEHLQGSKSSSPLLWLRPAGSKTCGSFSPLGPEVNIIVTKRSSKGVWNRKMSLMSLLSLYRSLSTCCQWQQHVCLSNPATDSAVCFFSVYSIYLPSGEIRRSGFVCTELLHLMADTRLLQKILLHTSTFDHSVRIEEDLQIFPKATGVVIADSFSVSKRCVWQNREVLSTWHRLPFEFQPLILSMCMFQKAAVVPSSMGLDCRICCSICCSDSSPLTAAKYWRISLVLSVFPAPDSPLRKREEKRHKVHIIIIK